MLNALQKWFQGEVVKPGSPRTARLILPSSRQKPHERMAIYADSYFARLLECLEDDFKTIHGLVGHHRFSALMKRYLDRFPSRHYSLNRLGYRLPETLTGLLRDVARIEVSMTQVFDAEEVEPLEPKDFRKIDVHRARLKLIPALQILELDYPANDVVTAVYRERKIAPATPRRKSWVVVYRKKFKVWRMDLSAPAHAALAALAAGKTVEQSVVAASRLWTGTPAAFTKKIRAWFGEWSTEGFFA